jgi:hypothetical protein
MMGLSAAAGGACRGDRAMREDARAAMRTAAAVENTKLAGGRLLGGAALMRPSPAAWAG